MTRKEKIYAYMKSEGYVPLKLDELKLVLDVPKSDYEEFDKIINELVFENKIVKSRRDRYIATEKTGLFCGIFSGTEKGFGFVLREEGGDVFVPQEKTCGALNGDEVLYRITEKGDGEKRDTGEIMRISKRNTKELACTFVKRGVKCYAVPNSKKVWHYVHLDAGRTKGALNGQRVIVKILKYPKFDEDLKGEVTEVLGWPEDKGVSNRCVMHQFGLHDSFPDEVIKETENIADEVNFADIEGRKDLTDKTFITIDGEDTKDIDDAVYVEKQGENYVLYVSIADVSHYVKPGMALHKEAMRRGTSVYLAGTVIPMLPPKLSNGICSLNEGVPRLTLTAEMTINPSGEVISHDIYKSVIKSNHRMTYKEVTSIIDGDKKLHKNYADVCEMIAHMKTLADILREKREKNGSINFNFPETKVIFDENLQVVDVVQSEYTVSNSIIEQFMLLANETVAEHFFWLDIPFVYRVHEQPKEEKMQELMRVLKIFGLSLKGRNGEIHPGAIEDVLKEAQGKPFEKIVANIALRSMMKAKYTTENLGHFGLASKYYCHFTSPIRRLADLTIHEIISRNLDGTFESLREKYLTLAQQASISASETEIVAEDAERLSVKLKIAEFMKQYEGYIFDGVVSSVLPNAFYVELENLVEGRVSLADMDDDYYSLSGDYTLVGERTGKTIKIGDEITILLARADTETGDIDFVPYDSED